MAVKAREIREMLHGKVDPGVINFMCALAEQQQAMSQQITELATYFDKMCDLMQHHSQMFADVESLKERVNGKESHDDLPDHTE